MTKFYREDFAEAAAMRASGVSWKEIDRKIGDGLHACYSAMLFRQRHPEKVKAARQSRASKAKKPKAVRTHSHRHNGIIQHSANRDRVMCNAWFGLPLNSGLSRTATERACAEQTIRILRRYALLDGDQVTAVGLAYLSQIERNT